MVSCCWSVNFRIAAATINDPLMTRSICRISIAVLAVAALNGCRSSPTMLDPTLQKPIDRAIVDYPPNVELTEFAVGLTAPSAMAFDFEGEHKGTLVVAESGARRAFAAAVRVRARWQIF